LIISASGWLFKKKSITMHGNMNVKMIMIFQKIWHISISIITDYLPQILW